jgi:hypothetical protein
MKRPILKLVGLSLLVVSVVEAPLLMFAQDNNTNTPPSKAAKSTKKKINTSTTQIRGKLTAVDKIAKTITVGDNTYQITSQTRIFKGEKPGILDDATVGVEVTGSCKKTDGGNLAATTVHFGAAKTETKSTVNGS